MSLQRPITTPVPDRAPLTRNGPLRITIRPPLTRYTDASKDYLGEGFAFLAKSCLSKFRCWIVIPWPSSGFDSAAVVDFTAVGSAIDAEFAVDCVLDWRTGGGKMSVTLIDCRDGSEVWSHLYMRQLRKKLETDPERPRHILTEPGIGYRFIADE